jgi:hypothetical protein
MILYLRTLKIILMTEEKVTKDTRFTLTGSQNTFLNINNKHEDILKVGNGVNS